ncbi:hypothetical protein PHMEG_00021392 [Phytophthora megakarya]|uniref:Uncharacterized protein n=1 Tax=Phytophthora megakarya TaxID=4795 RepID=A0A225VLR2_9STRA|nr:hypothetical protein PHMEG_00021392 [Phytophthora megakarya]
MRLTHWLLSTSPCQDRFSYTCSQGNQLYVSLLRTLAFTNAYSYRRYCCNIVRIRAKTSLCYLSYRLNNGNDIPRMLLQDHTMSDRPPTSLPGKKRRRRTIAEREHMREDSAEDMADGEVEVPRRAVSLLL